MKQNKLALISVSDKTNLIPFAKGLKKLKYDIVSTGGTAEHLRKGKVKVIEVQDLTGYPKMLEGRVKSLHPAIFSGILADRSKKNHMKDLKTYKIRPIDIVVCNLYPFEQVVSRPKFSHDEAIENIDIGGPSMVRAAAKNYMNVAIIVDPADYEMVLKELRKKLGKLSKETKELLASKAFSHTKKYDSRISLYFKSRVKQAEVSGMPNEIDLFLEKIQDLRYGENPHQKAAFYREPGVQGSIARMKQLHGKELSFNNIYDIDSAWSSVKYFAFPTVAIIKHTNPCGVGQADKIVHAYKKAFASDPVSAYGSVIAANRTVDEEMVSAMGDLFVEAIVAPEFDKSALRILKKRQNIRIIEMGKDSLSSIWKGFDYKRVRGGFLIQDCDMLELSLSDIKVVSKKQPSVAELEDMFFAWGVVKFVKSNAIVVAKGRQTLGVGAGQMSRVDSVDIALKKAGTLAKGAVLASDAFFPFRDSIDIAAKTGISAVMETGGSIRDAEVIQAANEHNMALVFTGRRHFRH
ncbi:MAG: bifunctional phosphoribosylaminoimidazolecarboxamide formyltransferase/IMP cyclohydrolase [bacterium]